MTTLPPPSIFEMIEMIGLVNYVLTWIGAITWIFCYVIIKTLHDIHKLSFLPTMSKEEYIKLMKEKGYHFDEV